MCALPVGQLGWQKRPARGQGTVPHPPCPAPINLFLARGVGPIPLPSKEIKGAQGDLRSAGQTGWRPGRSRVRLLRRLLQVLPVVVPKTRREGTYTRFHTARLSIPTVEDRGDATAWRETLRPHGFPARPEANGGIYYEVVRSKGMYLLRRSPESSYTAECPRCRKTLESLSGVGSAAAPSRTIRPSRTVDTSAQENKRKKRRARQPSSAAQLDDTN